MITLPDGLTARCWRHDLQFRFTAITSRAVMRTKETWILTLTRQSDGVEGVGECAIFRGLSAEDTPDYGERLQRLCHAINAGEQIDVERLPSSVRFGVESALATLSTGNPWLLFDTPWTRSESSIVINGLVWMGTEQEMLERIERKLAEGFRCLKLKIGGIDFDGELRLLEAVRRRFPAHLLELRADANGAFDQGNVMQRLQQLSAYGLHSIEQPVKAGQWELMAKVCRESPIPIALDEELIGDSDSRRRAELLDAIKPQFIILKPSLCGGLSGAARWIKDAGSRGIGWWITSALESNIGLNAIAQFASTYPLAMPQGLGTGALYTNNFESPLRLRGERLYYEPGRE